MKIEMLKTTPGSVDGIHIREYPAGEILDAVSAGEIDLARAFLGMGVARELADDVQEAPAEEVAREITVTEAPAPEIQPAAKKRGRK